MIPETAVALDRARLRVDLLAAARLVPPSWPIERFVAVNPLVGLLDQGFDEATAQARRWLGAATHPDIGAVRRALAAGDLTEDDLRIGAVELGAVDGVEEDPVAALLAAAPVGTPPPRPRTALERLDARDGTDHAAVVDAELARWCALLVDRDHLPVGLPADAYATWRVLAVGDRGVRRLGGRGGRALVAGLPERADDAVLDLLDRLGVLPADRPAELRGRLARIPGWAAYARWSDEWAGVDDPAPRLALLDLVAVGLALDVLVVDRLGVAPEAIPVDPEPETVPAASLHGRLALHALEGAHRRRLIGALDRPLPARPDRPDAQVVFCIDARSEGLRRHLEELGDYDTLGFAGFFGVPLRHRPHGSAESYASAPVLLDPTVEVPEVPTPGAAALLDRVDRRRGAGRAVTAMAEGPLSMYALAEGSGWLVGPAALARTLRVPTRGPMGGDGPVVAAADGAGHGFALEDRILVAESALRTMGLTRDLAPLVVLCGHGSTSTANPHAASLDCGACGGNRGGANARAAAAILNDPDVRIALVERGIEVPDGTWFVAAEHDTAVDVVRLLAVDDVPPEHWPALAELADALAEAGRRRSADRCAALVGPAAGRAEGDVGARAGDWAQVRPEWGLAGNAAFVIGHRDLTRGLDLGERAFLHSYDRQADEDGAALATILTAPVVVAHWINAQYYFSTVDNDVFGAGDKALHNVVAGVGVLSGEGGDLRTGLPAQSVTSATGAGHVPVRLLVVVDAPLGRVDDVIARHGVVAHLVDGAWIHVVARDEATGWRRRLPGGRWISALGCGPEAEAVGGA